MFWEMELFSLKVKKFLYFKKELANPENQKFVIFVERELFKYKNK